MYPDRTLSPFDILKTYVSKDVADKIRKIAENKNTTISKLLAIAIDNEMDTPSPFTFPHDMPSTPFIKGAYQEEAMLMSQYLDKFDDGADIETLMLHRHAIGIADKNTFMLAVREMLEGAPLVFELRPHVSNKTKNQTGRAPYLCYRREYRTSPHQNQAGKYANKLEAKIKRDQEKLNRMRGK